MITEDTKKYLKNFEDKVAQLEKFTQDSIKDYGNHDVKLKDDLKTLGLLISLELYRNKNGLLHGLEIKKLLNIDEKTLSPLTIPTCSVLKLGNFESETITYSKYS